jgi:hypothetical protein
MKTRVLKIVNQRVRIVKNDDLYVVQKRETVGFGRNFGEWEEMNSFFDYRKAVNKKNVHIVMVIMRELGYRREFVKRRTERKRKAGLIW